MFDLQRVKERTHAVHSLNSFEHSFHVPEGVLGSLETTLQPTDVWRSSLDADITHQTSQSPVGCQHPQHVALADTTEKGCCEPGGVAFVMENAEDISLGMV